jgi:metal-responsive CopG/Arc/MetJ family transcriptional regulator
MKALSVKFDNYVLDLLNFESKEKKVTRMEIIRSAVIHYLLHRDDAEDMAYMNAHKSDRLLTFDKTFSKV